MIFQERQKLIHQPNICKDKVLFVKLIVSAYYVNVYAHAHVSMSYLTYENWWIILRNMVCLWQNICFMFVFMCFLCLARNVFSFDLSTVGLQIKNLFGC